MCGVESVVGGKIIDVEDKMVDSSDEDSYSVIDVHFYTFLTDKGRADVELRVEHNGYYGGHLGDPYERL